MEPVCFMLYFVCPFSCMEIVTVVFVLIYSALIAPFFFSFQSACVHLEETRKLALAF